ncbi:MAG: hypothetical protein IBX60_09140, partial [Candidatus Aminicenantes bacterium]|nr:hypothetical protein [Candidatus Aminicenantes bacterium]
DILFRIGSEEAMVGVSKLQLGQEPIIYKGEVFIHEEALKNLLKEKYEINVTEGTIHFITKEE